MRPVRRTTRRPNARSGAGSTSPRSGLRRRRPPVPSRLSTCNLCGAGLDMGNDAGVKKTHDAYHEERDEQATYTHPKPGEFALEDLGGITALDLPRGPTPPNIG